MGNVGKLCWMYLNWTNMKKGIGIIIYDISLQGNYYIFCEGKGQFVWWSRVEIIEENRAANGELDGAA